MMTDQQVRRLMKMINEGRTRSVAAAKAGMSEKTARKYMKSGKLPSQMKTERTWRTRPNPFEVHWEEVTRLLREDATLEAITIFQYLQRRYPGAYQDGQLRTLQRHIKKWKAREGQPKDVIFAQIHHPGDQAQSDFTSMNELDITINNQPFPHLLYHFVLTYSNWEWVSMCESESFESLSAGVQNALWQLGAVPKRHKTDNLSAAVKDLSGRKLFTKNYESLMSHYGMRSIKNNAGKGHENGDVEQSHRQLKRCLKTEFLLRGSRDFESVEAYQIFLEKVMHRRNRGRSERLERELRVMRDLPSRRLDDFTIENVRVSQYSTIRVRRNAYSVDSRLIAESLKVHVHGNHLELWHAGSHIESLPRLRGKNKVHINYRHIIDSLVKKPGAFRHYKYQSELFPSLVFRSTYDWLSQHRSNKADREYVKILDLAAKEGERQVERTCRDLIYTGKPISIEGIKVALNVTGEERDPRVCQIPLSTYDLLLKGGCHD